uniref:C2H2-type domain-containing protein n=1 Tax=Caenorhabditis japonica TaxID=281687 RepID=A0A8R1E0B0_CAEJA
MNKGGACVLTTSSGGSASPTSSGAPSSSSILADADEKEQLQQHASALLQNGFGGNQWMQMLMNSQQQQQQIQEAAAGQLKPTGSNGELAMDRNLLDMFTGNADFAKLAAQLSGQTKMHDNEPEDARDNTPTPPAVSLNSSLAAMILPTTSSSTGCSAASTTSSVDSATSSVIVNGQASTAHEDDDMPPAKRIRPDDDETPVTPTGPSSSIMQSLLAQIGGLNPLGGQQSQKKEDNLFGGLGNFFPQSLAAGFPFLSSPIHQQFPGMADFEQLSALSTPNKSSGMKRQYSSNGKNYCDICNKEVCNKYFLRTHMLKMHGIVIDENKTVIANIDTLVKEREGELSFRCDTCRTMFKTRNQLRQHRQDVHGVLPLSTPRNNQNKPSMPSTPTTANNNTTPTASGEEKCAMCDKRFAPGMMMMHMAQEHLGGVAGVSSGAADLSHVMAILNQATPRAPSAEEKELGMLFDCTECSYKTPHAKNLELHLERHHKMNEAKQSLDDDEDEALKLTTEAALQMVVQNQNQFDGDVTGAALNLTFKNESGGKKDVEEEKVVTHHHERNSHTSGSISPSSSIPEGFGKALGEKVFPTQTFLVRSNDESGHFLAEFLAQLPVRSIVDGPRQIVFELLPTPTPNGV